MDKNIKNLKTIQERLSTLRTDMTSVISYLMDVHHNALSIRDVSTQMTIVSKTELAMAEYDEVVSKLEESIELVRRIKNRMIECDGLMYPNDKS